MNDVINYEKTYCITLHKDLHTVKIFDKFEANNYERMLITIGRNYGKYGMKLIIKRLESYSNVVGDITISNLKKINCLPKHFWDFIYDEIANFRQEDNKIEATEIPFKKSYLLRAQTSDYREYCGSIYGRRGLYGATREYVIVGLILYETST